MKLILDTNVVLDWLVFRDEHVAWLQPALDARKLDLITHAPAIDELRRVLGYAQFELTESAQQRILQSYASQTRLVTSPNLELPAGFPRCRDRDDQHFLVLAYHERADALISKDNAVLELSRRAGKFGVTILSPRQVTLQHQDGLCRSTI